MRTVLCLLFVAACSKQQVDETKWGDPVGIELAGEDLMAAVAVEAGRGESLRRLAGTRGLVYGIDRFGASAPYTDLAQFFGFTPDQLCARVQEHLRSLGEDA